MALHSNLAIPGLIPTQSLPSAPHIEVQLGVSPSSLGPEQLIYTSRYSGNSGRPALRAWGDPDNGIVRLAYSDGKDFWLSRQGTQVWARWPKTSSIDDAATYLLGPVLGALLRLRGVVCLHASAVALDDRAIAFVGPPGAGKSTTAAIFARRGCAVLADDVAGLTEADDVFGVLPAYPFLSLCPDAVEMLYGSQDFLPCFVPNWEKRCLGLGERGFKFEDRPLPLSAIYLLRERQAGPNPRVEPISGQAALVDLVTNSYATGMLSRRSRAAELGLFGRLISKVPVRLVRPLEDKSAPGKLFDTIYLDLKELGS